MSTATVRAALVNYFTTPAITGLGTVFAAEPLLVDAADYDPLNANPGSSSAAVGFVWFNKRSESRATFPAGTGSKEVVYKTGLSLAYAYNPQGQAGPEDAWVGALDTLVDDVVARIRADQTFGTGAGGAIFQAGEDKDDLDVTWSAPARDYVGGPVRCWVVVFFTVREIVTA